jgi:7-cyano-7-deazaguanine synthase
MRPAVVLLSGGLDSATCLAVARAQGFACHALTISYGQRHTAELLAAERVASALGAVSHTVVNLDLRPLAPSALTGACEVPKHDDVGEIGEEIPSTYVPARNIIFLSLAAAFAEGRGARDIFLGVNAVDYSGYPDCRPEFVAAFQHALNVGTRTGAEGQAFTIHAPLVSWTKAQIIAEGVKLGVDYALTHSCYDPDDAGRACGHCDSCLLRHKGFVEAGVADPTVYVAPGKE